MTCTRRYIQLSARHNWRYFCTSIGSTCLYLKYVLILNPTTVVGLSNSSNQRTTFSCWNRQALWLLDNLQTFASHETSTTAVLQAPDWAWIFVCQQTKLFKTVDQACQLASTNSWGWFELIPKCRRTDCNNHLVCVPSNYTRNKYTQWALSASCDFILYIYVYFP